MKLSTIHYQYIGELHVKLYQNWWSGFRDIRGQNTEGHSFIIIRIVSVASSFLHYTKEKVVVNKKILFMGNMK